MASSGKENHRARGTLFFRGGNLACENNVIIMWNTLPQYKHRQATNYGYEIVLGIFDLYENADAVPVTEILSL